MVDGSILKFAKRLHEEDYNFKSSHNSSTVTSPFKRFRSPSNVSSLSPIKSHGNPNRPNLVPSIDDLLGGRYKGFAASNLDSSQDSLGSQFTVDLSQTSQESIIPLPDVAPGLHVFADNTDAVEERVGTDIARCAAEWQSSEHDLIQSMKDELAVLVYGSNKSQLCELLFVIACLSKDNLVSLSALRLISRYVEEEDWFPEFSLLTEVFQLLGFVPIEKINQPSGTLVGEESSGSMTQHLSRLYQVLILATSSRVIYPPNDVKTLVVSLCLCSLDRRLVGCKILSDKLFSQLLLGLSEETLESQLWDICIPLATCIHHHHNRAQLVMTLPRSNHQCLMFGRLLSLAMLQAELSQDLDRGVLSTAVLFLRKHFSSLYSNDMDIYRNHSLILLIGCLLDRPVKKSCKSELRELINSLREYGGQGGENSDDPQSTALQSLMTIVSMKLENINSATAQSKLPFQIEEFCLEDQLALSD